MDEIKEILMERDKMTSSEAVKLILETQEALAPYLYGDLSGAEDVLMDKLGLEPDYIIQLIT